MVDLRETRDPFVLRLPQAERERLERVVASWSLSDPIGLVRRWLLNFDAGEKPIALKVLGEINYLNPQRFDEEVILLGKRLTRLLEKRSQKISDALVILPKIPTDSGVRLAYDLSKLWQLPGSNFGSLDDLKDLERIGNRPIVFFNDTHGSGDQFSRRLAKRLDGRANAKEFFIVAVSVAKEAHEKFRRLFPKAIVVPEESSPSVMDSFTAADVETIKSIGHRVSPDAPLGYGGCGLLVAYYYQCPNNTIPLIWADGTNNAQPGETSGASWSALFPYRPKLGQPKAVPLSPILQSNITIENTGPKPNPGRNSIAGDRPAADKIDAGHSNRVVFLHFLDHYFLEYLKAEKNLPLVQRECEIATRFALLAADEVLVSMASYIESPICRRVLDGLVPLFEAGEVRAVGKGPTLHDYLLQKLDQYPHGSPQRARYENAPLSIPVPLISRKESASDFIKGKWLSVLHSGTAADLYGRYRDHLERKIERVWEKVPERLGSSAFIVDLVVPQLVRKDRRERIPGELIDDLHAIINTAYFESIIQELGCGLMIDLVYLNDRVTINGGRFDVSYKLLYRELRDANLLDSILSASPTQLIQWRRDERVAEAIRKCSASRE